MCAIVHCADVSSAFVLALGRREGFDLFNIGTGRGTSIDELVDMLQEVSGIRATIERTPPDTAAERLPHWVVLDSSKAKEQLGWEAAVPLRDGIERLWRAATQ